MMNTIYNVIEVITVIAAFIKLTVWAGIKFRNTFSVTIDEIKRKAKKAAFAKFLMLLNSFIPAMLSVVALSIDIYLNRPFDTINFILISCFITLILWNVILVFVFEKIDSLELTIQDTSNGLSKLILELRQAKKEIQTTKDTIDSAKAAATVAIQTAESAQQKAKEADEQAKRNWGVFWHDKMH